MSFIYEALKRAEDENARGVVAPRTVRRPAFFATRPRWWLWALIGVLGANAALLVTLVLVRGARSPATEPVAGPAGSPPRGADAAHVTPPSMTSASPAVAAAPPPETPPARAVEPTPPVARPAPPSVAPAVRSARLAVAPATPTAPPPARPVSPAARVTERPATPVTPSVPRVDPPPPAPTSGAVARDTVEARPASPRPAVSPSGPASPPASAPAGDGTAPPAVDAPKLRIQVVVFSDVPSERMVIIDGRRYAEGDRIDAETVVERITPEGAVVTRRGQRFALISGRP